MTFFRSILLSFTIWILSALLNAFLAGTWLYLFSNEFRYGPSSFLWFFILTLLFSIPGIFTFWIVLLVNWDEQLLFRSLLKTGFIISALSSSILCILPLKQVNGQQLVLSLSIVIASIGSIMIHHSRIKSISVNKINNHA